ncbi:Cytochrome c oxidase assembly factor 5, partial [Opisthocomus hoazin]
LREPLPCLMLCVLLRQEHKSPKQCLREGHCRSLQMTFFACKRSMVSARGVF